MQEIKLQIVGWKKYQPQSDRSRHKFWFRVNMDCGTSHGLFGLSAEQRWFFVQLLCECCRKNSDTVSIKLSRFSKLCEIEEDSILSAIKLLEENGTVSILSAHCQSTVSPLSPHNKTIQDKTIQTKQDKTKTFSIAVKQVSPTMPDKESLDNYFINLSEQIFKIYPDKEFIAKEREKMKLWLSTNQKKSPKSKSGWTRFVMGWLERAWERYRKTINSERAKERGIAEILAEDKKNGFIDI